MMHWKRARLDFYKQHPFAGKLIVATESGDVAKVKRLLRNAICSGVSPATAASLALATLDPLENPTLAAHRLWGCLPHKIKEKRPNKRALNCVWQRISRSIGLLLNAGADPNAKDQEGCSVLCKIVSHKELADVFLKLLCSGANPNSHDGTGAGALFLAVMRKNEEGTRLLLEHGADPGTKYNDNTPLMFAAANQQLSILQRLINAGADLNCRDKERRTALMCSLNRHGDHPFLVMYWWAREADASQYPKNASIDITSLLLESGAEYEESDNNGFLPVDYAMVAHIKGVALPSELAVNQTYLRFCKAAMEGELQQLAGLLESEEIPLRIKSIALTLVAVRGFVECCSILLENGADPNKANQCGVTPAKAAAIGLQLPIIRLLVAHGLSKEEMCLALTDVCMALSHFYEEDESTFRTKRLELARYLLEQGADLHTHLGEIISFATLFEENVELVSLLLEFGTVPVVKG